MRLKEGPTHVAEEYRPSGSGTVTFLAVRLPLMFERLFLNKSSNDIRQLSG